MSDQGKQIVVKTIEREEPDLRRLARALIDLVVSEVADPAAGVHDDADDSGMAA